MVLPLEKVEAFDKLRLEVIEQYNKRFTTRQIANNLNITVGSVAGIIHRATRGGFGKDIVKPHSKKEIDDKNRQSKIKPLREPTTFRGPEMSAERPRLKLVDHTAETTFEHLKDSECKFPYGDPRMPDFRFCGLKRRDDKTPYCPEHCNIAYETWATRRKRYRS